MDNNSREKILKKAKLESELSDLKQHADKMIRGFEKFNNKSSNRAIWELIQNACDLTSECEVILDYTNGFSFTHNGKPFTPKSLISLIKQVSGKYGEESENPQVGKYGTGFLTTHTFGRKFQINSILEAEDLYFEIKDFLIDRSPKEWEELSKNISNQQNEVYRIIESQTPISNPETKTTFTFLPETEQERTYILESRKHLEDYIPIVLTINDRLKKVTIIQNDNKTLFERTSKEKIQNDKGIELHKTIISVNGNPRTLYSIVENDSQIEVILPINEELDLFEFSKEIARLFLYYPLIGSEDFGLNFIINCNKFSPTEPRDGIHLQSNKDQVKDQEEANRKIIKKVSQLIFDFLKSNVLEVSNPHLYAKINFKRDTEDSELNKYFEILQKEWIKEYKLLSIVETTEGFKTIDEVRFFDEELLSSVEAFDDIYTLASKFYNNIPTKDNIILWSKFAKEWNDESIQFIGHKDLVDGISKKHLSDFNKDCLINYYKNLIKENKKNYFSEYSLLPNLDGKFHSLSSLFKPQDLNETLIKIGRCLIPDSIKCLIHEDFDFNYDLEKFNRRDFLISVKTKLDELEASKRIYFPENLNKESYNIQSIEQLKELNQNLFKSLLDYCKLNNNINSKSKPTSLVKIISKYYSFDGNLIELSDLENSNENLDIRSAMRILVQIFFNLLQCHNEDWVKNNIELLLEIAKCNEDSFKDVYSNSKIYPNQLNQLKCISELKKEDNINSEIKDLYKKVVGKEIREELIYNGFNEFITEDRRVTTKQLTTEIEEIFFNNDIANINQHPFKNDILDIIKSSKGSDDLSLELFPRLDDRKANIMLEVVTDENTKDDIFSIVSLGESDLKKLGKLIQEDNFSTLLDKATNLLQQENQTKADFQHKYEIGTRIENLIRERLSSELKNRVSFKNEKELKTTDQQGGQDIVIYFDNDPIYYIEVKSRWDSKNSVSMSKLQLQRAVEENEHYALCVVDITRYEGGNDRYKLTIEEILPLTKFVTNIGDMIKPLIEVNLEAENQQTESIHLVDYRGIVPQEIIQSKGGNLNSIVNTIVGFISNNKS
ncbi:sacsin N-terminal ATP-binding-like domain-containing protein [Capnocytophaga canis]|uniref:Protein NO VEIN C-terminal domain-containing protein n=1 Tax=Capnocytophaga canis TaxID=1848903 RepID=A0A0B7IRD1_9FLAO|nr:DUF3883 domain-containing protein [Capnocytophaga canis]CEN53154.1 conserved hypothetical protein [Capnocytophaga canis]